MNTDQENYEEARQIVESKRDYSGFRRYMVSACKLSAICESCMCPLDIRLNATEKIDAEYRCKLENRAIAGKSNALTAFVRKYCTDYSANENLCIGRRTGTCLIMQGKPCKHFKDAVFPLCDPGYKYAIVPEKYETLLALYKKLDVNVVESDVDIRRCGCGVPLKPRQRYCVKCSKQNRKDTYRKNRQKKAG